MIQSMTGYGKADCDVKGRTITIEIKSLNSKQLDLSTRVPAAYRELEMAIRNDIQRRVIRGKVDISISFDNNSKDSLQQINADAFQAYLNQLNAVATQLSIAPPADPWPLLFRMPDVIRTDNQEPDEQDFKLVSSAIDIAISRFIDFRIQEGTMLAKVFEEKISRIEFLLEDIKQFESERIESIKSRITESLEKLGNGDYDKNRFEQELIYYIEKLDINEEKARLANHCQYFRSTMQDTEGQGKKLGFITQEIGREINTLGSKSNHTAMQQTVVCMKDELEQIKEQVLNVL